MQLIIPARVATWLRESEDSDHPELLRELRIQLASEGSEHHPARITALVSLWHDMVDPAPVTSARRASSTRRRGTSESRSRTSTPGFVPHRSRRLHLQDPDRASAVGV